MEKSHNFHGCLTVIHGPGRFKKSHGTTKQKLQYSLFVASLMPIQHNHKGCFLLIRNSESIGSRWKRNDEKKNVLSVEEFLRFETNLLFFFSFTGGPVQGSTTNQFTKGSA